MLFGPEFPAPRSTVVYDRKSGQIRDKALMKDQRCKADMVR